MYPESQQDRQKRKRGRPRKYDEESRRAALERVKAGQDVVTLARELGVNHTQIYRWRNEALGRRPVPRPDSQLQEKGDERQPEQSLHAASANVPAIVVQEPC